MIYTNMKNFLTKIIIILLVDWLSLLLFFGTSNNYKTQPFISMLKNGCVTNV